MTVKPGKTGTVALLRTAGPLVVGGAVGFYLSTKSVGVALAGVVVASVLRLAVEPMETKRLEEWKKQPGDAPTQARRAELHEQARADTRVLDLGAILLALIVSVCALLERPWLGLPLSVLAVFLAFPALSGLASEESPTWGEAFRLWVSVPSVVALSAAVAAIIGATSGFIAPPPDRARQVCRQVNKLEADVRELELTVGRVVKASGSPVAPAPQNPPTAAELHEACG